MSKDVIYKIITAGSRGGANHGWLNAKHSFSFANYYDPERIHFGALRVLNDDIIAPAEGFGKHPHDNMEIITIPLRGELKHEDSMGNSSVIKAGEIQVMSAGKGVFHSEVNNSSSEDVQLLQIWIYPYEKGVEPRYDQKKTGTEEKKNRLINIIRPRGTGDEEVIWIHQNGWFYLGEYDTNVDEKYKTKSIDNGAYLFVIEGEVSVDNHLLNKRDAAAIINANEITLNIKKGSKILLIEVPLKW
ncbi:MAG: pirin family protein [Bacteroidales bacterium]